MLVTNARKLLAKHGTLRTTANGQGLSIVIGEHEVSCWINGRDEPGAEITCERVRRLSDKDEPESDYCAGMFCDSLTYAIKYAQRTTAEEAEAFARHEAEHADPFARVPDSQGCMFCARVRSGRRLRLVPS